ncbi:MAG: alanine/glycine:cation symporter family protein, partial [Akkermansiaceae bacterium]
LGEKGLGPLGMGLAICFAIMCIGGAIGAGNMFQVNQAATQVSDSFGVFTESKLMFGVILAIIVGMVIIGGIVSIARVTSLLVPFMCGMYLIAALIIIVTNIDHVGNAFSQIVTGAFSPIAFGGGMVGVLIQGIKRAAFSNEAGIGSAPIAHSAVKTEKPASEGIVALLEPFTDTVVVCTMTALVLIITGTWKVDGVAKEDQVALYAAASIEEPAVKNLEKGAEMRILKKTDDGKFGEVWQEDGPSLWVDMEQVTAISGVVKTSRAFGQQLKWFPKLLAIAVLLFAFSTMISWSYYGEQAVLFLCGGYNPAAVIFYKVMFCAFVVVGSVASMDNVVIISDSLIFAMVLPNLIGVYLLLPVVKKELVNFRQHAAEIDAKK